MIVLASRIEKKALQFDVRCKTIDWNFDCGYGFLKDTYNGVAFNMALLLQKRLRNFSLLWISFGHATDYILRLEMLVCAIGSVSLFAVDRLVSTIQEPYCIRYSVAFSTMYEGREAYRDYWLFQWSRVQVSEEQSWCTIEESVFAWWCKW